MKFLKLLKKLALLLFVVLLVCIHYNLNNKLRSCVVERNQLMRWEVQALHINEKVRYKKVMQLTKPHEHDEMENVSTNLLNFTF